jgi:TolB-like protein
MRKDVMNLRFLKFPFFLFFFFSFLSSFAQPTLGILDFDNNSLADRQRLEPLRKGLAQMFSSELGELQGLNLVERADLLRVIEEMKLAQAGMIDEKTAQQVGKLVGAQHLLLGSFVYLPNGKIRLDARVVEVETGRILKAGEATGKENQLFDLVKALNKKLVKELALKLSASEVAKLDNLRNVKFSAVMLYSQAVAYEDRGDLANAGKKYRDALAEDANFAQAKQRLSNVLGKSKP